MPDFHLSPPQPAIAGRTVYAVLSRDGVTLAIVAMGTVDAEGNASGNVPSGISPGPITVLVYQINPLRPDGSEPDPGVDWYSGGTVIPDWPGDLVDPGDDEAVYTPILVVTMPESFGGYASTVRSRFGVDPNASTIRDRDHEFIEA